MHLRGGFTMGMKAAGLACAFNLPTGNGHHFDFHLHAAVPKAGAPRFISTIGLPGVVSKREILPDERRGGRVHEAVELRKADEAVVGFLL